MYVIGHQQNFNKNMMTHQKLESFDPAPQQQLIIEPPPFVENFQQSRTSPLLP